ncbi:MAG: hypothetical protein AB7S44_03565 [Spirochaetales bacterium]
MLRGANLLHSGEDITKKKTEYKSTLAHDFGLIKKLKDLKNAKNNVEVSDAQYYNDYYRGVYNMPIEKFIEAYISLIFKNPTQQFLTVDIVVPYFRTEGGHRTGLTSWDGKYFVDLRVTTENGFVVENRIYSVEEVEKLIGDDKIFASNWFAGKRATEEEYEKSTSYNKLHTLFVDNQSQIEHHQDFSYLPFYKHSYDIVRNSQDEEQINEDLADFMLRFESQVTSIAEKQASKKEDNEKKNYVRKAEHNADIIKLSKGALESLDDLMRE